MSLDLDFKLKKQNLEFNENIDLRLLSSTLKKYLLDNRLKLEELRKIEVLDLTDFREYYFGGFDLTTKLITLKINGKLIDNEIENIKKIPNLRNLQIESFWGSNLQEVLGEMSLFKSLRNLEITGLSSLGGEYILKINNLKLLVLKGVDFRSISRLRNINSDNIECEIRIFLDDNEDIHNLTLLSFDSHFIYFSNSENVKYYYKNKLINKAKIGEDIFDLQDYLNTF